MDWFDVFLQDAFWVPKLQNKLEYWELRVCVHMCVFLGLDQQEEFPNFVALSYSGQQNFCPGYMWSSSFAILISKPE